MGTKISSVWYPYSFNRAYVLSKQYTLAVLIILVIGDQCIVGLCSAFFPPSKFKFLSVYGSQGQPKRIYVKIPFYEFLTPINEGFAFFFNSFAIVPTYLINAKKIL